MNISLEGALGLIGCLVVAMLPLPRRAEGLRIGFFSAVMAFVFYDAVRKRSSEQPTEEDPEDPEETVEPQHLVPVMDLTSTSEADRLRPLDLLTDFSILRHLRRTGAVSDREYEAKKVNLLRRV